MRYTKYRPDYLRKWVRENAISSLRNLYNINEEIFYKLLEDQNYSCAVCKKHQTEFYNVLGVDHDHLTGKVRGLLCIRCNTIVGYFEKTDFAPIRAYLGVK